MKPRAHKPQKRTPTVPPTYRDLKSLRRQTGLRRLKPETVKAIAKYHRMKRPAADPEMVALWLAETIFEKTTWP